MPCSPCHPSHCPSCYTTHFWVKQRQERAPGNEHRLMISRENRPEPRREQTSHTTKRITRERIFCFSYVPKLELFRAKMLGWGKKDGQKERDESIPKSRGKAWKMLKWGMREKLWPVVPAPSKSEWRSLLLLSERAPLDERGGESRRRRALQTCGSH